MQEESAWEAVLHKRPRAASGRDRAPAGCTACAATARESGRDQAAHQQQANDADDDVEHAPHHRNFVRDWEIARSVVSGWRRWAEKPLGAQKTSRAFGHARLGAFPVVRCAPLLTCSRALPPRACEAAE